MKDGPRKAIRKKPPSNEDQVQKRSSANSRERERTQEINKAFNMLRSIIPSMPADKMSKIHTLRIATAYIAYLAEMLNGQSDFDAIDCNPQTSFHVWRSNKAQQQLSSSVTSFSLLDSKAFGRYSTNNVFFNNAPLLTHSSQNDGFCKTEWTSNIDEYSSLIPYNNVSAFANQSEPQIQAQSQLINHSKE